jgi:hypothetical protein
MSDLSQLLGDRVCLFFVNGRFGDGLSERTVTTDAIVELLTAHSRSLPAYMDQSVLLEELDVRQNEVLDRLAELNARVEALVKECLVARDQKSGDE